MGQQLDVGENRQKPDNLQQLNMASELDAEWHIIMDHRWFVQQEASSRLKWSGMGNYVRKNRQQTNGFLLGAVRCSKFIPSRTTRAMCTAHPSRAIAEYFHIMEWKAVLCCNNEKALEMSLYHLRRINPSAKCAHI
jgi:hypothetical protein